MQVVASYTRKINLGLYGGNDYEMKDFFCSLNIEIPDDEDPKGAYKDLVQTCRESVEEAVEEEIIQISGGLPKKEWDEWLKNVVGGKGWGTSEQYETMSPFQKNIAQMLKRAYKRSNYKKNESK